MYLMFRLQMPAKEHVISLLLGLFLWNVEGCDVRYCEVSEWSAWSGCSQQCGDDTEYRTRYKVVVEACGGDCHYHLREERSCPKKCLNGGTPAIYRCACRTGYTGKCCEQQSGVKIKRDGNTETNPPSQETSGKKCGGGCIAGVSCAAVVCCGCVMFLCLKIKSCHGWTFQCNICNKGSISVNHNSQIVPTDDNTTTNGKPNMTTKTKSEKDNDGYGSPPPPYNSSEGDIPPPDYLPSCPDYKDFPNIPSYSDILACGH